MRITFSVLALLLGITGAYLVGTGVFLQENFPDIDWVSAVLFPFTAPDPFSCLVLTMCVAFAFFGLAVAATNSSIANPVKAVHIFLWGGLFSVLTSAGFTVLLYFQWQKGTADRDIGLLFSLAAIQGCLGLLLGGGATLAGRGLRRFTVPVFLAGALETVLAGFLMSYGFVI